MKKNRFIVIILIVILVISGITLFGSNRGRKDSSTETSVTPAVSAEEDSSEKEAEGAAISSEKSEHVSSSADAESVSSEAKREERTEAGEKAEYVEEYTVELDEDETVEIY